MDSSAMAHVVEPFSKKEYIGQEFRQAMAGLFDLKTCGQLTKFWEGPVGRKYAGMSDGATVEEAIANRRDAFSAWIAVVIDIGKPVPKPTAKPVELVEASGKFVARLPKTLHARLVTMARQEGVSLNSLVLTLISESIGHKEKRVH